MRITCVLVWESATRKLPSHDTLQWQPSSAMKCATSSSMYTTASMVSTSRGRELAQGIAYRDNPRGFMAIMHARSPLLLLRPPPLHAKNVRRVALYRQLSPPSCRTRRMSPCEGDADQRNDEQGGAVAAANVVDRVHDGHGYDGAGEHVRHADGVRNTVGHKGVHGGGDEGHTAPCAEPRGERARAGDDHMLYWELLISPTNLIGKEIH